MAGSDYKVQVIQGAESDKSNNVFTINNPTVEYMAFPNGGTVARAQTVNISWSGPNGASYDIFYRKGRV